MNFLQKIEKVMYKHPASVWHYTQIAEDLGFSSMEKAKEVDVFLKTITSKPDNSTPIRRGKKDGYYYLREIRNLEGD